MLSNNEYEVTIQSNTVTNHLVTLSDEVYNLFLNWFFVWRKYYLQREM